MVKKSLQNNPQKWTHSRAKFSGFYSFFRGCAHLFPLHDAMDMSLWRSPLPYTQLAVFVSPLHAIAALRMWPNIFTDLLTPLDRITSNIVLASSREAALCRQQMLVPFVICTQV